VQNDINTAAIYRYPIKGQTGKHVAMVLRRPEPSEFICQVSTVLRALLDASFQLFILDSKRYFPCVKSRKTTAARLTKIVKIQVVWIVTP